jgi:hypothetical protein
MTEPLAQNIIQQQSKQVRDFINNPRKHYELRQNRAKFFQLCSSLDVIEDTEEAVTAYMAKEFGESKSAHYLAIYGLLQAIYVQQDAVINLCESLGIQEKIDSYPKLKKIREIRNDIVGHPTKRDMRKGQPTSYHHLARITLTQSGFKVASYFADGSPTKFREIDTPNLVAEQRRFISTILAALIGNLETEEETHKAKFRMEKLVRMFPDGFTYSFEKLFEGVIRDDYAELGVAHLEQIGEVIQDFRAAIGKRDMDFYESLQDEYVLIEHAVLQLRKYFRGKIDGKGLEVEKASARIFAAFLQNQVDDLKGYAKQIDGDYEVDVAGQ